MIGEVDPLVLTVATIGVLVALVLVLNVVGFIWMVFDRPPSETDLEDEP